MAPLLGLLILVSGCIPSAQSDESITLTDTVEPTPIIDNNDWNRFISLDSGSATVSYNAPLWVVEAIEQEVKRLENIATSQGREIVVVNVQDDCPYVAEIDSENVSGTICVEPPRIDDWG